jgi:hypothetical protein
VAGEMPSGKGPPLEPSGPGVDAPRVDPALRLAQAAVSASVPTQTAPSRSQNPVRGLQKVPPTHCA